MSIQELLEADFIGAHDTKTHRVCGTCGKLKPVEEFYKDGMDKKGNVKYRRDCKDCYKKQRFLESKLKRCK